MTAETRLTRSTVPAAPAREDSYGPLGITYPSIFIFTITIKVCSVWLKSSAVILHQFYLIRSEYPPRSDYERELEGFEMAAEQFGIEIQVDDINER